MAALALGVPPAAAGDPEQDRDAPVGAAAWRAEALARAAEHATNPAARGSGSGPERSSATGAGLDAALSGARLPSCYHRGYSDYPLDSPGSEVTAYALSYACRYGIWYLDIYLRDPLGTKSATVFAEFDIDRDMSTGCAGSDWGIAAFDLLGFGVVTDLDDDCYLGDGFGLAFLQRQSERHVTLMFETGSIGAPGGFFWRADVAVLDPGDLPDLLESRDERGEERLLTYPDDLPDAGRHLASRYQIDTTAGSSGSWYLRRGYGTRLTADHDLVLSGDWNGDGRDDLLFYGFGRRADAIWLAKLSTTGFRRGPAIDISSYVEPIPGDFNGDGRDDVLLRRFEGNSSIRVADGSGGFKRGPEVFVSGSYDFVTPGDFNGDGRTDLFLSSFFGGRERILYARRTSYGFVSGPRVWVSGELLLPIAGDFNGDGRDDLLFSAGMTKDSDVLLYARPTSNGFSRGPTPNVPFSLTRDAGDFDGDGDDDLVDYGPGPERDRLLRTEGGGVFAWKRVVFNGVHSGVATGDFNGDGRDDVLLWGNGYLPDRVWYGKG